MSIICESSSLSQSLNSVIRLYRSNKHTKSQTHILIYGCAMAKKGKAGYVSVKLDFFALLFAVRQNK